MRRLLPALAILAIAVGAAWPAAAQAPASLTKVKISYIPAADESDIYVALHEGYFTKHGLAVELTPLGVSTNLPPALISGSVDFGAATAPTLVQARDGGLDLVAIAGASVTDPTTNSSVIARTGSGLKAPADLIGRKVGVPGFGAFMQVLFRQWLTDKKIDDSKVIFVEASFPQMSDMLKGGTVDAVLAVDPFYSRIVAAETGYPLARFVAELPAGIPTVLYVATRDWAKANGATIKAFREAIVEGKAFAARDGDATRRIISEITKIPLPALAAMPIPALQSEVSAKQMEYWIEIMTRQGMLTHHPEAKDMIVD